MRPRFLFVPLLLFFIFIYVSLRLHAFIRIFFAHSGPSLSQIQILDAYTTDPVAIKEYGGVEGAVRDRIQHIPKIVHQIFQNWTDVHNEELPEDWRVLSERCRRGGGDDNYDGEWKYFLWTPSNSTTFLKTYYPWFLPTYISYPFPIQRTHALRYFLIYHFGGMYIDLDNGCTSDLSPLLYYPSFVIDSGRTALSNSIFGSKPHHPFWQQVIESLERYNWDYVFPYVRISWTSGNWFLTSVWEEYFAGMKSGGEDPIRVIMDARMKGEWTFFSQGGGATWGNWDNYFWLWVGDHLALLGLGGVGIIVGLGCVGRCCVRRRYRRIGAGRRKKEDDV